MIHGLSGPALSSPRPDPPELRFAVDCMLGSLAKWLLILGNDTLYLRKVEDSVLVARARAEDRILVTRDRRLTERRLARPFLLIGAERVIDQLREVVAAFDLRLDEDRLLSRCLRCNAPTLPIGSEAVRQEVPAYVLETQTRFRRCPSCSRVYWGGTHRDRMRQLLDGVFSRTAP